MIVSVWHKEYIDWVKTEYKLEKITPKIAIQPILKGNNKNKFKKSIKNINCGFLVEIDFFR